MRICLTISFVFLLTISWSQRIAITVEDEVTQDALPYVEVRVEGQDKIHRTDLNGRVSIVLNTIPSTLHFRYFNCKDTAITVRNETNLLVRMVPATNVFEEVVVIPKEDPAYGIIRKVLKNKDLHDPYNKEFMYRSYDKFYFTFEPDTTRLSYSSDDSSVKSLNEILKKNYLFFTESVQERYYKSKVKDKTVVLSHRASGIKDLKFSISATELQPFGFYDNKIELAGLEYLNPVSRVGLNMYYLELQQTTVDESDTLFTIYFKPLKDKYGGVIGMMTVRAPDYAIEYIEARPLLYSDDDIRVKIRQKSEKSNGYWFPKELNTTLFFPQTMGGTVAAGRTVIDSVSLNPDFSDIRFDHIAKDYENNSKVKIEDVRDTLSSKEKNTYVFMDSLGEEHNLSGKMKLYSSIATGRIPIKFVDLDITEMLLFDDYEGFRLGAGLYTNDRISKYVTLGGYGAYGLKDKQWKYGSSLELKLSERNQLFVKGSWYRDIFLVGHTQYGTQKFQLYNTDDLIRVFRNRADNVESFNVSVGFQYKHFKFLFSGDKRSHSTTDEFAFSEPFNEGVSVIRTNYSVTELGAEIRFLYNEKFTQLFGTLVSQGSDYPIVTGKYTRGLNLLDGDYVYDKFDLKVNHTFKLLRGGRFTFDVRGGMVSSTIPISLNYNMLASNNNKLTVSVPMSFETMRINEFFAQRYVSAAVQYGFRPFFKTKLSAPFVSVSAKGITGTMDNPEAHGNLQFKVPDKPYYETGMYLNNLLLSNFYGLGIGASYRLGHHSLPTFKDNLAVKISLSLVI